MEKSPIPKLPNFVNEVVSRLPRLPSSFLFVTGLNLLLMRHMPEDTLEQIQGKCLRVHVLDAGLRLDYRLEGSAFRAVAFEAEMPDVTFAANAWDFYILMQREEDPDTLFFSRRLSIEGDTELGLLLKNTLDAIDTSQLQPGKVFSSFLPGMRPRLPRFPTPVRSHEVTT